MKQLKILTIIFLLLFVQTALAEPSFRRQKNTATKICGTILNATTAISIGAAATGLDCEEDLYTDAAAGDGFADVATAETVVGATGEFCVSLTAGETNSQYITLRCQATNTNAAIWLADIDTNHGTVLTNATGQLDTGTVPESAFPARGTAQGSADTSHIQLAASEAFSDDELNNNTAVHIVSATTGGGQTRCVTDYVGSTDTATIDTFQTALTGTITYSLIPAPHCNSLQPTVNGRTLDVATTGEAGVDLSNVNGTLDAGEIGANAITSSTLATDAIGAAQIAANAIGASELATDAIGALEIATDAIGAAEIAADAIGSAEVAAAAITSSEFTATPTIGGVSAGALADFFDTDSTQTYGAAIAGSVVKEIADNAAGGGGGGGGGVCTSVAAGGITAASFGSDVIGHQNTAQAVSAQAMTLAAAEAYGNDALKNNASVLVTSATTGAWQLRCICGNILATDAVTLCKKFQITPTGTVKYAIVPTANCNLAEYPSGH